MIGPLYHYTTPKGFEGIVKKGNINLWFTHYQYFEDESEGKESKRKPI